MGARGPQAVPEHLRKLHGNPARRPLPEPLVPVVAAKDVACKDDPITPQPPDDFDEIALATWNRAVPALISMGCLAHCDGDALINYCRAASRAHAAEVELKGQKMVLSTPNGASQINPLIKIAENARSEMLKFAVQFGLTPAARVRLGQPREGPDAPASKVKNGPTASFGSYLAARPPTRVN